MNITIELSGGAELLFGNKRKHEITLPEEEKAWTMGTLIPWIRDNLLQVSVEDSTPCLVLCL